MKPTLTGAPVCAWADFRKLKPRRKVAAAPPVAAAALITVLRSAPGPAPSAAPPTRSLVVSLIAFPLLWPKRCPSAALPPRDALPPRHELHGELLDGPPLPHALAAQAAVRLLVVDAVRLDELQDGLDNEAPGPQPRLEPRPPPGPPPAPRPPPAAPASRGAGGARWRRSRRR